MVLAVESIVEGNVGLAQYHERLNVVPERLSPVHEVAQLILALYGGLRRGRLHIPERRIEQLDGTLISLDYIRTVRDEALPPRRTTEAIGLPGVFVCLI